MLWGSNVTSTNEEGQICSLVLKQLASGTDLMVVHPRKTVLAEKAKLWIQLRPGSDHALALAFLNVIITEEIYDKAFVENGPTVFLNSLLMSDPIPLRECLNRHGSHRKSFEKVQGFTRVPGLRLSSGAIPLNRPFIHGIQCGPWSA